MPKRQMHLIAYLKTGATSTHPGGWRHPEADLHDIFSPERYAHIARVLENACFDGCFYADTMGIPDIYNESLAGYLHHGGQLSYLDPLTVLPVMAAATRHLGLGATLSTTFHNPYHLARTLASLDHFSKGRACWNVVTSSTDFEAQNFGMEGLPAKDARYDRADEVLEACCALWDCWEPDALIQDKAKGIWADPAKVRYASYVGKYVRTRGPLSLPRSPQGRPVLMQAGSSPRGRAFAARWAEAIFSAATTVAACVEFYTDVKTRMRAHGRAPGQCAILPAISVVLGETPSIARERAAYLNALIDPEHALAHSSAMLGADLGKVRSTGELGAAKGHQGHGGLEDNVRQMMEEEGITFEEANRRPHGLVVGTASMVADHMQKIFAAGGCDGFVIQGNVSPGMFEEFGRLVVPELQNRGLLRTAYAGATMRENLLG